MLLLLVRLATDGYFVPAREVCAVRIIARSSCRATTMSDGAARPVCAYQQVTVPAPTEGPPAQEITVSDLMPHITSAIETRVDGSRIPASILGASTRSELHWPKPVLMAGLA